MAKASDKNKPVAAAERPAFKPIIPKGRHAGAPRLKVQQGGTPNPPAPPAAQ